MREGEQQSESLVCCQLGVTQDSGDWNAGSCLDVGVAQGAVKHAAEGWVAVIVCCWAGVALSHGRPVQSQGTRLPVSSVAMQRTLHSASTILPAGGHCCQC